MKRFYLLSLALIVALFATVAAAPVPPAPNVTFELLQGLPSTMQVGDTATVQIRVTSDTPYNAVVAMPDAFYPGRYVVPSKPDHSGSGTEALISVTFKAKETTIGLRAMPDLGVPADYVPVSVIAGVRFKNGTMASQQFDFLVKVP